MTHTVPMSLCEWLKSDGHISNQTNLGQFWDLSFIRQEFCYSSSTVYDHLCQWFTTMIANSLLEWSFWIVICISRIFYSTIFSTLLVVLWFAEFRKYLRVLIARWRVGQIKIQNMDTLRREWINTQLRIQVRAGCTRFFSDELLVFRVGLMILVCRFKITDFKCRS